ncbi:MAG: hypothetical protein LM549_00890, partial [Candidatus Competibacter sp.]|nr:hypothetical protein [Candidatus Competibacter sp.]
MSNSTENSSYSPNLPNASRFSIFSVLPLLVFCLWSTSSSAGPATGSKTLNAPANPIETGRPFVYQLDARCPGSISPQDDCLDYRITDTLPANLQATALPPTGGLLEKVCLGTNPDRATCPPIASLPTPAGATLTFFLRGGTCPNTAIPAPGGRVCAGAQQSLDFSAQFVPGLTLNNAPAINPATFTSTDN